MSVYLVPRICREQREGKLGEPRLLTDFRDVHAYVLLGEPGAGKTSTFEYEAEETTGYYVRARDFVELPLPGEANKKTLFIDGLDEMRAGSGGGRTGLGEIRRRLAELGVPRFRLSCREADWREAADRADLERLVPGNGIVVVHLDRLSEQDIANILRHSFANPAPADFIQEAHQRGLAELLRNPQTLKLIVDATADGQWPKSRAETYELACRQLVREENDYHRLTIQNVTKSPERLLV